MDGSVDILNCPDQDFDEATKIMDIQELVTTIASLQSAMSQEQHRFNDLTSQMSKIDQKEQELYHRLSSDLMTSQLRLGMLMNRNVKCFQQQAANENQNLMTQLLGGMNLPHQHHANNNVSPPTEQDDTDSGVDTDFVSATNKDVLHYMPSGTLCQKQSFSDHENKAIPQPKIHEKSPVNFDDLVLGLQESSVDDDDEDNSVNHVNAVMGKKNNRIQSNYPVNSQTQNERDPGKFTLCDISSHTKIETPHLMKTKTSMITKLGKDQDNFTLPNNKISQIHERADLHHSNEAPDVNVQSHKKKKRVQFAPDTEFHERENPKPKLSVLDLQDRFPVEGEPDEIEVEGEADEDGLVTVGEGDEAGMEDECVDVGTYPDISGDIREHSATSGTQPIAKTSQTNKTTINKVSTSFNVKLEHDGMKDVKDKSQKVMPGSIASRVSAYLNRAQSNSSAAENEAQTTKRTYNNPQKKIVHVGAIKSREVEKTDTYGTSTYNAENSKLGNTRPDKRIVLVGSVKSRDLDVEETNMTSLGELSVKSALVKNRLYNYEVENKAVGEVKQVEDRPAQARVEEVWDEPVAQRATIASWNPEKLLSELYKIDFQPQHSKLVEFPSMEGYLEKLPLNKRKNTLLKTWKKRYFRVHNGCVQYDEVIMKWYTYY